MFEGALLPKTHFPCRLIHMEPTPTKDKAHLFRRNLLLVDLPFGNSQGQPEIASPLGRNSPATVHFAASFRVLGFKGVGLRNMVSVSMRGTHWPPFRLPKGVLSKTKATQTGDMFKPGNSPNSWHPFAFETAPKPGPNASDTSLNLNGELGCAIRSAPASK